jgi:DNA transformation protein
MAVSREYRDFIAETLAPLGRVSLRRMFGGAGIFQGEMMFGLMVDDTLYFKVDAATQRDYEAAGMQPFTYKAKGRERALGYWQVPDGLLDDPDELCRWARLAVDVALRAAKRKPGRGEEKTAPAPAKAKANAKAKTTPKAKPKGAAKVKSRAGSKPAAKPPRQSRRAAPARGSAPRSRGTRRR